MLGGQPNHVKQLCFPLKLHAGGLDISHYDGSDFKTYGLMRWWGFDALAVCQAHRGLPVRFLCSSIQFYLLLSPYLCFISFYILFWEMMHR